MGIQTGLPVQAIENARNGRNPGIASLIAIFVIGNGRCLPRSSAQKLLEASGFLPGRAGMPATPHTTIRRRQCLST
jgi:hypothetical protein